MRMLAIAIAALLVAFAALAEKEPRGSQLKNADLARTFTSGTITVGDYTPQTLSSARLFLRGGILHAIYADPDGNGDYMRGQWRIDQDRLCTASGGATGMESCGIVYKLSDGSYQTWVNGKLISTFRVIPPPVATALKPAG